jgi:hypothetical protein
VTVLPSGTLVHDQGNRGSWTKKDRPQRVYTLRWLQGDFVDTVRLSEDGQRLSGSNQSSATVSARRLPEGPAAQPESRPPSPKPGQGQTPPPQPQATLTDETLAQMLRNLGYPVWERPWGVGRYWSIQLPEVDTGHPVTVEPGKTKAGEMVEFRVYAPVGKKISRTDPTLADKLAALNKANTVSGRYAFGYFAKTGAVELRYAHERPTANAEEVREIFTRLAKILTDTRPLWRELGAGAPAASPAPAPGGAPPTQTVNLAGTIWVGTEEDELRRSYTAKFTFLPGGRTAGGATVYQNGNLVEISFNDRTYKGDIKGDVISGTIWRPIEVSALAPGLPGWIAPKDRAPRLAGHFTVTRAK